LNFIGWLKVNRGVDALYTFSMWKQQEIQRCAT
jgi:hypothetical protein